jgi:hypothetical protein
VQCIIAALPTVAALWVGIPTSDEMHNNKTGIIIMITQDSGDAWRVRPTTCQHLQAVTAAELMEQSRSKLSAAAVRGSSSATATCNSSTPPEPAHCNQPHTTSQTLCHCH